MLYPLARHLLFRLQPETAHDLALAALNRGGWRGMRACPPALPTELMGITLPNPVGLAAGLDKNGAYLNGLGRLGFGFVEIGTVTPRPQPGNPKPRMFRLPQAEALINRLGFNNDGVEQLVRNVEHADYTGVLGINIGKNKDTPLAQAAEDYLHCLNRVYALADYITVNVSSPNTEGLRELQQADPLRELLSQLLRQRDALADRHGRRAPMVVKVAPDMNTEQITAMADVFRELRLDGVIATNTTIDHTLVADLPHGDEAGGLSGGPLRRPAARVLEAFHTALAGELPLIGVGGITRGEHAREKQQAGAQAVQIYTGFIYRGPGLIRDCVTAMAAA